MVLAKITVPVNGEKPLVPSVSSASLSGLVAMKPDNDDDNDLLFPMTNDSVDFALELLDSSRSQLQSRDREVFTALIELHAHNLHLIVDVSKVIAYMCRLQPAEFVFVSFAVELERFARRQTKHFARKQMKIRPEGTVDKQQQLSRDLQFVSSFIAQMCHVLLNAKEAKPARDALKDCIGNRQETEYDQKRSRLFQIMLYTFSHNLVASTSLCLWGGAFRTAHLFLKQIDPLDIHLMFLLELDKLVEMLERPLFRHLHIRMLEHDDDPLAEGSGTMLFQTLRSLLMCIPQSTCYKILSDRLASASRFRQTVIGSKSKDAAQDIPKETEVFVNRVLNVRSLHCGALWETIRAESLEEAPFVISREEGQPREEGADRRKWLGFFSKEEERKAKMRYNEEKMRRQEAGITIEEVKDAYNDLDTLTKDGRVSVKELLPNEEQDDSWKAFWTENQD